MTETITTAPSTPPSAEDLDKAAIADVYEKFWDAVITSENGPRPDRALFDGIAAGDAVEQQIFRVRGLVENDVRRIGTPEIGEPQITVDTSTARVEACVDQDPWLVVVDGATPSLQPVGPRPMVVDLERIDGQWLVTAQVAQEEATLSC